MLQVIVAPFAMASIKLSVPAIIWEWIDKSNNFTFT